jgi:hypothetical protein
LIRIWDSKALKQREREARDEVLAAQSDDDWKFAVLQLERGKSDLEYGFADCPLPACRRAKHCVGNPLICTARGELQPGSEQGAVEEFYADIQQERRNAAAQGRPPDVERVLYYVQQDDETEELDEPPPAPPPRDGLGRNMRIASEALRRDEMPSQPSPQLQLRKPEPPADPPPVAPVAIAPPEAPVAPAGPPPPAPWEPQTSPEVEERVNRIWADYVAARPLPRPEPRIRSLSDDRPWSVPPWWKGPR